MELFASPMACSLASHITALEAGLPVKVRFVKDKKTDDGGDYFAIAANGYVPALRLDDGRVLNEGPSVLQYLADAKPESGLAPAFGSLTTHRLLIRSSHFTSASASSLGMLSRFKIPIASPPGSCRPTFICAIFT